MAHEIDLDTMTGRYRMYALVGIPVWHGLGQRLDAPPASVDQLLEVAGLDWTVGPRPLHVQRSDGGYEEISDRRAIVRESDGRYLGTVGMDFSPAQNREVAELAWAFGEQGVEVVTAGALRGGWQTWILCRYPEVFSVAGEEHRAYLCVSNAHDGTRSLSVTPTDVTVVCANTLALADRDLASGLNLRHTASIVDRAKAAVEIVRNSLTSIRGAHAQMERLAEYLVNDDVAAEYLERVANVYGGTPGARGRNLAAMCERYRDGEGMATRSRTMLRAYHAVTETIDHVVRPGYVERPTQHAAEARMMKSIYGVGAETKRRALTMALEVVGAGDN